MKMVSVRRSQMARGLSTQLCNVTHTVALSTTTELIIASTAGRWDQGWNA